MKKALFRKELLTASIAFAICFSLFFVLLTNKTNGAAFAENTEEAVYGVLNYSDGAQYEGDILYGRIKNGAGTFTWISGETYSGTWLNDSQDGDGEMTWPDLGTYTGSFENGKRNGQGVFTWIYDGEPEEGAPVSYEGDWVNDQIGPSGKLVLFGIGTYEGEFEKNVRSGSGAFTWVNGDIYRGNWKNDSITGEGTLTLSDGTELVGTFNNGILNKGTITYFVSGGLASRPVQSGRIQSSVTLTYSNGTVVSGKLKEQEFTGNVTIDYPSGDKYVGTLKAGVKSGKGIYTWKSGAHYNGEWENDKMSGKGTYYYGQSEKNLYLSGTFKDGKPFGTLTYVSDNNLKYTTSWTNGVCSSIKYKK